MEMIQERLNAIRGLNPLSPTKCAEINIQSVHKGGYFDLDGQTWLVERVNRYLDVKWKNFKKRSQEYWVTELKLFSLNTGNTTYLEWEVDDELEICQTDSEIKLRDIQYGGKPITHNDIAFIEDEEYGQVNVNGRTFHYSDDDTWAGLFYSDTSPDKEIPVRCYEFESDDNQYLTIELWQGAKSERPEREAFISHSVKGSSIQILQIGSNNEDTDSK